MSVTELLLSVICLPLHSLPDKAIPVLCHRLPVTRLNFCSLLM